MTSSVSTSFIPGIPCCPAQSPALSAPRESLKHTPWYHWCRLSPNPFVTPPPQSGSALHRGTPQVHCHSQWQILPEGFNFLLLLFAEFLCRSTYPGTFEGKAQFVCRPTAHEASYQLPYLQQWTYYTKKLTFKVSVLDWRATGVVREGRRQASITDTRRAEQSIAFPFHHMLAQ